MATLYAFGDVVIIKMGKDKGSCLKQIQYKSCSMFQNIFSKAFSMASSQKSQVVEK